MSTEAVALRDRAAWADQEANLHQLGFWSAVVSAAAALAFDVTVPVAPRLPGPWDVNTPLLPSLVLAPAFLALMVSVHAAAPVKRKAWTRLAAAFTAVYVPLTTSAYVIEIGVVQRAILRGQADGVALLTLTRIDSILNAIDGLGYGFMSLAAFFAAPAFGEGRLEGWIRWLFFATGILVVPILLTYFVDRWFIHLAALWGITVPVVAILLAVFFRRRC